MDEWRTQLRRAREHLRLSREAAARLSGVGAAAIKTYELGNRRAPQPKLMSLLIAYRLSHEEQRRVLEAAGYVAHDRMQASNAVQLWFTAEEAEAEVQRQVWPAFVLDEFVRLIAANDVAQRLWGVDLRVEFTNPVERNLLSVASNPRFADRCLNWDEAVRFILSAFKAHDWAPERVEQPGPYFAAVMEHFMQGDPRYVGRFLQAWEAADTVWTRKERFTYPIVWDEPGIGTMHFKALSSSASDPDGLSFNDWIPLDADTWHALVQLKARGSAYP
jgi:transcriptional regulator with XRE-family HTH domain